MTEKVPQSDSVAQQRQLAQAIAVVGIIFTLVFLCLMIVKGYRQYMSATRADANLTVRKQQLLQQPDNKTLIETIREQDRTVRASKLRQIDFTGMGSLMLLLSAAVAIGALKWLAYLKGIAPEPFLGVDEPYVRRKASASRITLVVIVVSLAITALLLGQRVPSGWVTQTKPSGKADYASPKELAKNWHRFRGFAGAGVTSLTDIPAKWDGASGSGILWKTQVPLPGHNSPVVWKDRIFLSGANYEKRVVYCFDASSGKIIWTGEVPTAPGGAAALNISSDTGLAPSTVATDGARVYAIFPTGDLGAFDFEGHLLWHKSLGIPKNSYGHASSLEVWQGRVLVQYDQASPEDGISHLYAFDGATGDIAWDAKRPVARSWSTPIVAKVGKDYQLITAADPLMIAYDPNDGKEIWRAKCLGGEVAPSPILAGDQVIALYPGHKSVAVRTGGTGDVTATHVAWANEDVAPEIGSPVADDHRIYFIDTYGTLYVLNSKDGKLLYQHDFEDENVKASPTLVSGKLYVLTMGGTMYIGTPGEKEFTLEAKNALGEECNASPAFMDGRIYIRGTNNLYCIGK
jgi:outer membrane protein assembly factor BamB